MPPVAAIAAASLTAQAGLAAAPAFFSTVAGTAAVAGAGLAAHEATRKALKSPELKFPGDLFETEPERIREVGRGAGLRSLSRRSQGRRATILTSPSLQKTELFTKRPTLLGGGA